MHPVLKNVIAVVAGIIVGSIINMGIVMISGQFIPPPAGVDVTSIESLKASMHLFETKHFLFPFLAHAIGTLVGAYTAARIAGTNKAKLALVVGVFFLLGGIANNLMIHSPTVFAIADILFAYIPMAWLGGKMGSG